MISIRSAKAADMDFLAALDHNYSTESVWQMDVAQESSNTQISFRESRLPRIMTVNYPESAAALTKTWKQQAAFLVAHQEENRIGYVSLSAEKAPETLWVTSLAVLPLHRRKSIGTQLIMASQKWAKENGFNRLVMEMQSKNMPAIRFAQKLAFEFCGYNDRYYENQDIALFFAKRLD